MNDKNFISNYFDIFQKKAFNPNISENLIILKNMIIETHKKKGKVILIGNGGSSAIASHVSVDLNKAVGIRSVNFNEYDLITCLLLVAKKMVSPFNIYYLSDGITYSARDIYNQFCQILNIKTPSWNVPWFIFVLLSLTTKKIRRKIRIIFGNYVYSSKKIKNLGFVPKKTLKDFNETDF